MVLVSAVTVHCCRWRVTLRHLMCLRSVSTSASWDFLAEIDLQGMYKAISRLAQGNYTLESRSLLQARVICGDKLLATAHALNDLVLAKGMFSKLAHMMRFY